MTELTQNIKPIYLGYDKINKKYWFYILKDGVPRFLSYVSYFFFDKGPQNVLELSPIPEAVEVEMSEFLSGNLHYDFVKRRKNSKETSARKLYRNPQDVSTDGEIKPVRKNGGGKASSSIGAGRDGTSTGGTNGGSPSPVGATQGIQPEQRNTLVEKPKRHRRTKAEMEAARAVIEPKKQVIEEIIKGKHSSKVISKIPVEVVAIGNEAINVKPKRRVPKIPR